jgi:hypothetical protein
VTNYYRRRKRSGDSEFGPYGQKVVTKIQFFFINLLVLGGIRIIVGILGMVLGIFMLVRAQSS